MYADMAIENRALKDLIEKKLQGCARNAKLVAEYTLPLQSSCRCNGLSRAAYYKNPIHTDRDAEVIKALNPLIERHPRWGFWMCRKVLKPRTSVEPQTHISRLPHSQAEPEAQGQEKATTGRSS